MPMTFDATLKDLVRRHPEDFRAAFRLPKSESITVLNVDLSHVTAATDVVLAHGHPGHGLTDVNFQSGHDGRLIDRVLMYNAILRHREGLPVHSIVVLLRPEADAPLLTGRFKCVAQPRRGWLDFRYEVIRLWKVPARRLLRGGMGALPLALLGRFPANVSVFEGMTHVRQRIEEKLSRAADPPEVAQVLMSSFLVSGLRLPWDLAADLFQGVPTVRESSVYQGLLLEGELNHARRTLLRLGRERFGGPPEEAVACINGLSDLQRLDRMSVRLLHVENWEDLLATQ